jgi:hypothetical protein
MTPRAQLAAGFLATVAILVPAGWHSLGANIEKDGKHLRPMQQKVTIDGVEVALDVDRSVVMTGDTVTATLVATSDSAKDVTVDLRALHSSNYSGERVERPWQQLDRETITLHAAPSGGKAVKTRIKLGERPAELALEDSFRIMVTKHGKKPEKREFDTGEKSPDYGALAGDDGTSAAAIYIRGWSGNSLAMTIAPKGPVTGDAPFTIAVTIKNTTDHELASAPWIRLSTEDALTAGDDEGADPAITIEDQTNPNEVDERGDMKPLPKHASVTKLFTVTPHKKLTGSIAFLASATENEGLGPYGAGAMDIETFQVTESHPSLAAK